MRETILSPAMTPRGSTELDLETVSRERDATAGSTLERVAEQGPLVYADPASRRTVQLLTRIAASDLPVIILGEAGTGKEVVARQLHKESGRKGPFVSINCGATAAQKTRVGPYVVDTPSGSSGAALSERWFEAASHGTLFLDEIAELPSALQAQLLRLLQESEMARAGLSNPEPLEVRLVAATRIDVSEAVAAGQFRLDLFYRLNVGQVRLLPLRQRRGDIAVLAQHFVRMHARRLGRPAPVLNEDVLAALKQHSWPGNIRELENVIRFALLVAPDRELLPQHLQLSSPPASSPARTAAPRQKSDEGSQTLSEFLLHMFQTPGPRLLNGLERQVVAEAFNFTGRNQVRTAALLGISRNVLRTLLTRHGLLTFRRRKARGRVSD